MINELKILALIPARGGSKGIKNKNIISICGKPLIAYSIEAAKKSKYIDRILVSTDCSKIASVAKRYGAEPPFLRPSELAQDQSKSIEVIMHAIKYLENQGEVYDALVLLQPTQPLRTSGDIDMALETFISSGKKPLASVSEVDDHPLLIRSIDNKGMLQPLLSEKSSVRRQDMMHYYRVNGCIYINCVEELSMDSSLNDNIIPYVIPKERSVDIDELQDVALVKYYMTQNLYINDDCEVN